MLFDGYSYTIAALNECCLLVTVGNEIAVPVNELVSVLNGRLLRHPFAGFTEAVPAFCSLAVFYDPLLVKSGSGQTAAETVREYLLQLMAEPAEPVAVDGRLVEIPVWYNGPDLQDMALALQLSRDEIIILHTTALYRVMMTGFLPGFAYLGTVDERIAMPRKAAPRAEVAAGSVGIAGMQTGIYPLASPGGWQLIGQTPLKVFDPAKEQPCLLLPHDRVQFIAITQKEFEQLYEY